MLSFANPTLPEFSDDLLIAPAVVALQGHHGKPNTFSSYTTRRDTALQHLPAVIQERSVIADTTQASFGSSLIS